MSGQDISMELVEVAKEVHLSAKSLDISSGLSKVISKQPNLLFHPQVLFTYIYHIFLINNIYHMYKFGFKSSISFIFVIVDRIFRGGWESHFCGWILGRR